MAVWKLKKVSRVEAFTSLPPRTHSVSDGPMTGIYPSMLVTTVTAQ